MNRRIQGVIRSVLVTLALAAPLNHAVAQQYVEAAAATDTIPGGSSFYSATLNQPPFPFNPFPELPLYDVGNGRFVYDDRSVDYTQIRAEAALKESSQASLIASEETAAGGGGMSLLSGGRPVMGIELTGDNGRRITFATQPGLVYTIEKSTDLSNWSVLDTIVADDTNKAFFAFGNDNRFYRVVQGSDLIQFPNWYPIVEQSAYIDVYTSLRGLARVEMFRDSNPTPWFTVEGGIPSDGYFHVDDGLYNSANWPFDGFYNTDDWLFVITIFPDGAGLAEAPERVTAIVAKRGRRFGRYPHSGITVQQYNAFGTLSAAAQEEIDGYMLNFFLANWSVALQVGLSGQQLNEFTDPSPSIRTSPQDWDSLRNLMFYGTNGVTTIDRLHYFGHGTNTSIGQIQVSEIETNIFCTNAFNYVALDGCRTAQTLDMLSTLTCYTRNVSRAFLFQIGATPRFGWGWKNAKNVGFQNQGVLIDNHFHFVTDFYVDLLRLNGAGNLYRTYREAYEFARDPLNGGSDPALQHNPEAASWNSTGCDNCFFDL